MPAPAECGEPGAVVSALGPDRGSAGRGGTAAVAGGAAEESAVGPENLESVGQDGEFWTVREGGGGILSSEERGRGRGRERERDEFGQDCIG